MIPKQALSKLQELGLSEQEQTRVFAISNKDHHKPQFVSVGNIKVHAVAIPHAGYPRFKDVENLLFQVSLAEDVTVMHMGDAGDKDEYFLPYKAHWKQHSTDLSFPPYWFLMSAEGRDILESIIQSKRHIGVHVPQQIPGYLNTPGLEYFSKPGTVIEISN